MRSCYGTSPDLQRRKMSLRADSNIRIDPVDAMVTGFIAAYIDHENGAVNGDEAVANWLG